MSLNPPDSQFPPSLVDRYPPHGCPPYLGLGLLDEAEPGRRARAITDFLQRES